MIALAMSAAMFPLFLLRRFVFSLALDDFRLRNGQNLPHRFAEVIGRFRIRSLFIGHIITLIRVVFADANKLAHVERDCRDTPPLGLLYPKSRHQTIAANEIPPPEC